MTAAIQLDGVSKAYRNGVFATPVLALRDVSLLVARGEAVGVAGASGAGKSTLLHLILGLARPTKGRVLIEGAPAWEDPPRRQRAVRRRIQPIFQNPAAALNPAQRVSAILEAPLAVHHIGDRRTRRQRIEAMLGAVGLDPALANRRPAELSGGEKQRVAIVRALLVEPQIIVADEPTAALDTIAQAQILDLLADARDRLGLTLVLVSHNPAVLDRLCSRTVHLDAGRLAP